jgi:hypothetical protein
MRVMMRSSTSVFLAVSRAALPSFAMDTDAPDWGLFAALTVSPGGE